MKLQDALKKIIREFGMSVLREKRLLFILSDYKAFDDYPAVKQIMKSIAEDGYGKELCRLGMDGSGEECLNYAGFLKKTLSFDKHFKPELTDYAVDCILFSMGFVSSVREPSDRGFDPFGNGSASHEQDIQQKDSVSGSHKNENHTSTESAEDWYRLGMSYANGSGVHQNYSMAVEYWRKAAELGHSGAQRCLGFAYAHGNGVAHDNAAALMWYRKAAAQGDSIARLELNSLLGDIQRSQEQSAGMTAAAGSPEKVQLAAGIKRKSVSQAASTPAPVTPETGTVSSTASQQNHVAAGQNSSGRSPAGSHGYSGGGNSGQNRRQGLGDSHPEQNGAGDSSVTPDPKCYSDRQYSLLSPVGWFTVKGRIGVAQFWSRLIILYLLCCVAFRICAWPREHNDALWFLLPVGVVGWAVLFGSFLSILGRRFHDLNWSFDYGPFVCLMSCFTLGISISFAIIKDPNVIFEPNAVLHLKYGRTGVPIPDWLAQLFGAGVVLFDGYFLLKIGFSKGTDGDNQYGPDPTK